MISPWKRRRQERERREARTILALLDLGQNVACRHRELLDRIDGFDASVAELSRKAEKWDRTVYR